jgi:hypothetical protein
LLYGGIRHGGEFLVQSSNQQEELPESNLQAHQFNILPRIIRKREGFVQIQAVWMKTAQLAIQVTHLGFATDTNTSVYVVYNQATDKLLTTNQLVFN